MKNPYIKKSTLEKFIKNSKAISAMLLIGLLTLSGCSNKGEPGEQSDPPPFVSAEVFGVSSSTSGTLEVRSGSDIVLSGSNSDGLDDPIISFDWQQIDSSGYAVDLYERATSTVVFSAPKIPLTETGDVVLEFMLTVTDADGVTASDTVSVQVIPVDDIDHFLISPNLEDEFVLAVAADPGAMLANDVPVDITVRYNVQWFDRSGNAHNADFDVQTLSGIVPATASAGPIAGSDSLLFRLPLVYLDIDLVNTNFTGANRDGRLELELVDTASVTATVSFQQNSSGDVNVYMVDSGLSTIVAPETIDGLGGIPVPASPIIDAVSGASNFTFDPELMRQQLDFESKLSATNYYNCIDPTSNADTFIEWLAYAGIQSGVIAPGTDVNTILDTLVDAAVSGGFSSVTHTTYANNYDLGFGRDMFTMEGANGNIYSFVINYPNLENALSKRNDFAIVVMEFSPAPTGNCGDGTFANDVTGQKIVKFYAYVPDELTGTFPRAASMNFDGRGEKYLPGVCTACHGGSQDPSALNNIDLTAINADAVNLSAGFMPWDLDSLLYTDTISDTALIDPVYSGDAISDAITEQFSRESQQAAFRLQNLHALKTYTYDIETLRRFEEPIRLIHGWYGNSAVTDGLDFATLSDIELLAMQTELQTLPDNDFDGTYVQPGWVGQEDLYLDVYARNCRLCHIQLDPGPDDILHFANYDDFISHENLITEVYERGTMPGSRFTADRFWVDFYGNQSDAEILRDHLNSDLLTGNDVAASVIPGQPAAIISPSRMPSMNADVFLDFDQQATFDSAPSLFADSFQWQVDGVPVFIGDSYTFSASTPGDVNQVGLIATDGASGVASAEKIRRVETNNYTPDPSTLSSPAVTAGQSVDIDVFEGLCAGNATDAAACRSVFGDIAAGEAPIIGLSGTVVNGTTSVSQSTGMVTFTSNQPAANGDGQFGITLTDSFGETSSVATVTVPVNPSGGPVIGSPDNCTFTYLSNGLVNSAVLGGDPVNCPDPASNDTSAFTPLTITSVGTTVVSGTTATVNSGIITYTPTSFFFNGLTSTSASDSFTYTVQDGVPLQSTGTVNVAVNATQAYTTDLDPDPGINASITAQLQFCTDCHAVTSGQTNFSNYASVLNRITNSGAIDISQGATTTDVDLLGANLFQRPCTASHGPGSQGNYLCGNDTEVSVTPTTRDDLNDLGRAVFDWLKEGAPNN